MKHCFHQYLIVKRCYCQFRKSLRSGVVYVSDFQNFCMHIVTYTRFLLLAVIFLNKRPANIPPIAPFLTTGMALKVLMM